jgi:Domain of unknown function (DUF4338)/DDE_Tnp_1-associated
MSLHLFDSMIAGIPPEPLLLGEVIVRLIKSSERERFDEELVNKHYLKNANAVGAVLRYVAEYRGHWVALLMFNSAAYHIKVRDQWLHWVGGQVAQRRHLLAQNSRFLVLAAPGKWPNLASRVLKLTCARLAEDWHQQFGYPVLAVETFVDPQRFRGTCYKAAGWEVLGPTQGHGRNWQDFYTDTQHPKELWMRPLSPQGLEQLRAPELSPELADPTGPLAPACPVATKQLHSLHERFRAQMTEHRHRRGLRHQLASCLTIMALATVAGCRSPHAMAQFADGLNHAQRRALRCWPRRGRPREYDVPGERTFRRLLKKVDPEELKKVLVRGMEQEDPNPPRVIHADGKVVKNAEPAPARPAALAAQAVETCEIPPELQKPKADKALTLVNFQTTEQRLVDQIAVPQDTNEEAAVAAHWPKMDLAGVCLTTDAAHLTKANCRQLTQNNGADFLIFLKANQPTALAKAEQLLPGTLPPSGQNAG